MVQSAEPERLTAFTVVLNWWSALHSTAIAMTTHITIIYSTQDGPHGGGNQFLKALRAEFERRGIYTEDAGTAAVALFNSHQGIGSVLAARRANPKALFIHRVDGPMRLYNEMSDPRDHFALEINRLAAAGTVFQSAWSRTANHHLGWPRSEFETVIGNAPDPAIFNRGGRKGTERSKKVRLISTSWSANPNKGFDVFEYLDSALDFSRFDMRFVGNCPVTFGNIKHIPPLSSQELAWELKRSHVFIAPSRKDPCSNSLVEALHCGVPAVARDDGGHPEILAGGGELFHDEAEIIPLIKKIVDDFPRYQEAIRVPAIDVIADRYLEFAAGLWGKGD